MCGIVAYSGRNGSIVNTLVTGLKRLEYRGYNSAGLAITAGGKIYSQRAVGKVINLEQLVKDNPPNDIGTIGIAHTRWATHGIPSRRNAHPQTSADKKVWLVHNGIIENYQTLKSRLQMAGVKFDGETDTEVVAKLIGELYRGDLRQAVLEALPQLKGAFALAIISQDEPGRLIGVKFGSPLAVGLGKKELIVASDVSAIIDRTKKVIYLEDGELIDIQDTSYEVLSFRDEPKQKTISTIDWGLEDASKQGHDHFLIKEIMEQPTVVKDSVRGRIDLARAEVKFGGLLDVERRLKAIRRVILLGVGTSYYAAKLGELYFNALTELPATAFLSPEFRYTKNPVDKHTWIIAISQSGETADTIAALEEAKRHGALTTGLVNVVGSSIARLTEAGVYNHIGPEVSVASTKAFTSQSVLLLMHAILLGRKNGLDYANALSLLGAIEKLPQLLGELLAKRDSIRQLAQTIAPIRNMMYIGRRYNYPIALEGALKIKEIAYIHAEGLSGGELKHGFIALIEPRVATVALATDDEVKAKMLANIAEVEARGGRVIAVTNGRLKDLPQQIVVPKSNSELIQPIINNVALQLLAYYVAREKKLNIDQPRNLAKSVTVE